MIIASVLLTTALDDTSIPKRGGGGVTWLKHMLLIMYQSFQNFNTPLFTDNPRALELFKTDMFKFKCPTIMPDLNFKCPSHRRNVWQIVNLKNKFCIYYGVLLNLL